VAHLLTKSVCEREFIENERITAKKAPCNGSVSSQDEPEREDISIHPQRRIDSRAGSDANAEDIQEFKWEVATPPITTRRVSMNPSNNLRTVLPQYKILLDPL
jgi:hypothetical protein